LKFEGFSKEDNLNLNLHSVTVSPIFHVKWIGSFIDIVDRQVVACTSLCSAQAKFKYKKAKIKNIIKNLKMNFHKAKIQNENFKF